MKRKILVVLCVLMTAVLAGCANYSSVENALDNIEIESELPEVQERKFTSIEQADDAVYEQQIAACDIYAEVYEKTHYQNFLEENPDLKKDKVANICNIYRKNMGDTIATDFYKNIYAIIKDCDDCTNKEAFLEKTNNDVLGFYDAYAKYKNAENPDEVICDILLAYAERRNVLALSFLDRNRQEVYRGAVSLIEQNSETEDEYRFYLNKNNNIITALNEVYDGVPKRYAAAISEATAKLSMNLLNSLESLTEWERKDLMEQLNISTPSPSPKPTPTLRPSDMPSQAPVRTMPPATQVPVRTAAPATRVTQPPVVRPQITEEPEETPQPEQEPELPEYNFDVND